MSKFLVRLCALAFLIALPLASAQARELRVTLNMESGSMPLSYSIPESQLNEFWSRWGYLSKTERMVPLGQPGSYGGVVIRDTTGSGEDRVIRLYSGVGSSEGRNRETRLDEGRQLERWVLAKAPPPLGPALLRALDEELAKTPGSLIPPTEIKTAGVVLMRECQQRARGNLSLRATCLEDSLEKQLGTEAYVKLMEKAVSDLTVAPRMANGHDLQQMSR